ncbi:C39 family peptidase [Nocardia sp. NPDC049149]|uniref:C39 family peptidase n=1 Tax=Nocardia sp. NPDC049149 TaxID=3364315 RepID=UPI0037138B39
MPTFARPEVPYLAQWESAHLVGDILTGQLAARDDPRWARSGAASPHDYEFWARRLCGVACLRMVLAGCGTDVPTAMTLANDLLAVGGYERDGDRVIGLKYAPFAEYVNGRQWPFRATVAAPLTNADLLDHLRDGHLAMVSVNPAIRDLAPDGLPIQVERGGHLVLATQATDDHITFHNPSGWPDRSQRNAVVRWESFDAYYAGRGILLHLIETGAISDGRGLERARPRAGAASSGRGLGRARPRTGAASDGRGLGRARLWGGWCGFRRACCVWGGGLSAGSTVSRHRTVSGFAPDSVVASGAVPG